MNAGERLTGSVPTSAALDPRDHSSGVQVEAVHEVSLRLGVGNPGAPGSADHLPGLVRPDALQPQDDCGQQRGTPDAATAVHSDAPACVQFPAEVPRECQGRSGTGSAESHWSTGGE